MERKMEDVLCIITYRRVFVLDMGKILRDEGHQDETSPAQPPLLRILDFLESGLPLGMGILKSGNFLYMFGGEYRDNGYYSPLTFGGEDETSPVYNYCRYRMVYGAGLLEEDSPCPVYKLDLTNNQSEPVKLEPMLGPKLYAFVEEIGGLIYILSQKCLSLSRPLFEVWDPKTEKSRNLPNPPSFLHGWNVVTYHVCDSVRGKNIVCGMENCVHDCFNTDSEDWESVEVLPPELRSMDVRDVRNKDVYLTTYGKNPNVWATMVAPEGKDGDCISLEFDISITKPLIADFTLAYQIFLADTSQEGDYMCGLVPYQSVKFDHSGYALYVFVFQVEKKFEPDKVPPFTLSVKYLRRQLYDFADLSDRNEEIGLFIISKAFIGKVSQSTSTGSDESHRQVAKEKEKEGKRKRKDIDDVDGDADDDGGIQKEEANKDECCGNNCSI